MKGVINLDKDYCTTRSLIKVHSHEINKLLNESHKLHQDFKYKSFLPTGKNRVAEGGLRVKGYFKKSYNNKPLISIVTVVFNSAKYLEETIQSVINQTYDNVEYIIIDAGSTDGSLNIIKKYSDRINYWVSESDNGIYDAWNKALMIYHGQWIGFLGADDFYEIYALQNYVKNINKLETKVEYISSQTNLCTKDKKIIRKIGKEWSWGEFSKFMNVAHVGSLHHRSLFEKYGIYNSSFKICGDYELLIRARDNLKTFFINETLCNMRGGGVSSGNTTPFIETFQIKLKYKTRPSFLHTYMEMILARVKWTIKRYLTKYY